MASGRQVGRGSRMRGALLREAAVAGCALVGVAAVFGVPRAAALEVRADRPSDRAGRAAIAREAKPTHAVVRQTLPPPATTDDPWLTLGDRRSILQPFATHPLELRRDTWRVLRRNLEGEVVLEVAVANQSLQPMEGRLQLTTEKLPGIALLEPLGEIEGGGARTATLAVEGLDPLDLLGGSVALDLRLLHGEVVQDEWTYRLPDAARDLDNRDLLLYMVRLARSPEEASERIDATRALLLRRLREDWSVAVASGRNPYKTDYRAEGSLTALGDLVRTCRAQTRDVRRHAVFSGLSTEVLQLADELPGAHPLLRRYVRKLARRLP